MKSSESTVESRLDWGKGGNEPSAGGTMGERDRGTQGSEGESMGTSEAPGKANRSRAAKREEPAEGKTIKIGGQVGSERTNDGTCLPKDVST
jgi:hypothetical protein